MLRDLSRFLGFRALDFFRFRILRVYRYLGFRVKIFGFVGVLNGF